MDNVKVMALKTEGNLYCTTGTLNSYRYEFLKGHGGSRTEATWDKKLKQHDCCKSKVCWRHKTNCKKLNKGNKKWQELGD